MSYSRVPLLLLLAALAAAAAAAAADSAQVPSRSATTRHWPTPPAPDAEQRDVAFRNQITRPCECLNGGTCHPRLRVCQCPLGYQGHRCERPDYALFEEIEVAEAAERAAAAKEEERERAAAAAAADTQRVLLRPVPVWPFYVPLFGAIALLTAMLRVLGVLGCTILRRGEEKKLPLLHNLHPYDNVAKVGIYTLPLQPPPYSVTPGGFAHSTPCCTLQPNQKLQPLQQLQIV